MGEMSSWLSEISVQKKKKIVTVVNSDSMQTQWGTVWEGCTHMMDSLTDNSSAILQPLQEHVEGEWGNHTVETNK